MVDRFTKAIPTTGEMPRDSLMAQMICCSLPVIVEAAVRGRPRERLLMDPLVVGVGVSLLEGKFDVLSYDVEVPLSCLVLDDMMLLLLKAMIPRSTARQFSSVRWKSQRELAEQGRLINALSALSKPLGRI